MNRLWVISTERISTGSTGASCGGGGGVVSTGGPVSVSGANSSPPGITTTSPVEDGGPAIDVTAFADHVGQAWVAGPRQRAFSFAPVPALRASGLGAGLAPDFELPDREGRPVRLSDLRGKKVLLLTWASW